MSDLLECNFCTFTALKARAQIEGRTAELRGGTHLFIDGEPAAIFLLLTTSCCC